MSDPHPDYEYVNCPACGFLICRNGEDEHNLCVLVLANLAKALYQCATTIGGDEAACALDKKYPWLKKEKDGE